VVTHPMFTTASGDGLRAASRPTSTATVQIAVFMTLGTDRRRTSVSGLREFHQPPSESGSRWLDPGESQRRVPSLRATTRLRRPLRGWNAGAAFWRLECGGGLPHPSVNTKEGRRQTQPFNVLLLADSRYSRIGNQAGVEGRHGEQGLLHREVRCRVKRGGRC